MNDWEAGRADAARRLVDEAKESGVLASLPADWQSRDEKIRIRINSPSLTEDGNKALGFLEQLASLGGVERDERFTGNGHTAIQRPSDPIPEDVKRELVFTATKIEPDHKTFFEAIEPVAGKRLEDAMQAAFLVPWEQSKSIWDDSQPGAPAQRRMLAVNADALSRKEREMMDTLFFAGQLSGAGGKENYRYFVDEQKHAALFKQIRDNRMQTLMENFDWAPPPPTAEHQRYRITPKAPGALKESPLIDKAVKLGLIERPLQGELPQMYASVTDPEFLAALQGRGKQISAA